MIRQLSNFMQWIALACIVPAIAIYHGADFQTALGLFAVGGILVAEYLRLMK